MLSFTRLLEGTFELLDHSYQVGNGLRVHFSIARPRPWRPHPARGESLNRSVVATPLLLPPVPVCHDLAAVRCEWHPAGPDRGMG
jgi:hypothetical protein